MSHSLTKPLNGGKAAIGNMPTAITAESTESAYTPQRGVIPLDVIFAE